MTKIYIYRMATDSGVAPCVFELGYTPTNILTLACCKGGYIRTKNDGTKVKVHTGLRKWVSDSWEIEQDVYVMGIHKTSVIYVAKIDSVISMKDYFKNSEFQRRMDCIYEIREWSDQGLTWFLKRLDNFNAGFHSKNDTNQHHKDELGEAVLLSKNFTYFGNRGFPIPEQIKVYMPVTRETKIYDGNMVDFERLKNCMDELLSDDSEFEPMHKMVCGCSKSRCIIC